MPPHATRGQASPPEAQPSLAVALPSELAGCNGSDPSPAHVNGLTAATAATAVTTASRHGRPRRLPVIIGSVS
jgi:hypothetical protein